MQDLEQKLEVCLYFDVNQVGWKKKGFFRAPIPERERERKWQEYRDNMKETLNKILEFIKIYGSETGYEVRAIERDADEIIVKIKMPANKDTVQEVINITKPLREYFRKKTDGSEVSVGVGLIMDDAQDACKDAKLKSSEVGISNELGSMYPKLKIPDFFTESRIVEIINNNYF